MGKEMEKTGDKEYGSNARVLHQQELDGLVSRCDEYLNTLKRVQADFLNYQERMKREKDDLGKFAVENFARELLTVADGLEKAIASAASIPAPNGAGENSKTLLEGVKLVERELHRVLARFGVTPIETKGARFDPLLHEALMTKETGDAEEMAVLQEFRRGYMIHGRVLRPAQVQVAKKSSGNQ